MACTAASATSAGPSVSGKPWPRLMAPVLTAKADISAKIVVPKPCRRGVRYGTRSVMVGVVQAGQWDPRPRLRRQGDDGKHGSRGPDPAGQRTAGPVRRLLPNPA